MWITPDRAIVYSSVNYVRNIVNREVRAYTEPYSAVVVDCSQMTSIDFTTAKGFKAVIDEFKFLEKSVIFYNPNSSTKHTFVGACPNDIIIAKSLDALNKYVNRN